MCVAVSCSELQGLIQVAPAPYIAVCDSVFQFVCCSELQGLVQVALALILQCVTVCCGVCVAVSCKV